MILCTFVSGCVSANLCGLAPDKVICAAMSRIDMLMQAEARLEGLNQEEGQMQASLQALAKQKVSNLPLAALLFCLCLSKHVYHCLS